MGQHNTNVIKKQDKASLHLYNIHFAMKLHHSAEGGASGITISHAEKEAK